MYFISTFVVTLLLLLTLKPAARLVGLVDIPGGRKQHKSPTPTVGGLGIYIGILAVTLLYPDLWAVYGEMLIVTSLVVFIGIFDDLHELRVSLRMVAHLVAAWVMAYWAQNQLSSLGDIFAIGAVQLGILTIPLTLFATLGVINAVNMTDGVDGLCGILTLTVLFWLGMVAYVGGDTNLTTLVLTLGSAIVAFLTLNFRLLWGKKALIYLGDTGSTSLGFILAWLIISATQGSEPLMAPVVALWFLALPLIDTVSLMILRPLLFRTSPFQAGTDHLHHRLMRAGYCHKQVVMIMAGIHVLLGSVGFVGWHYQAPESLMFLAFMLLFVAYVGWNYRYQRTHSSTTASL